MTTCGDRDQPLQPQAICDVIEKALLADTLGAAATESLDNLQALTGRNLRD